MPFTQCTALGRKVKLEDWMSFHRDRLLATLYTLRDAGNEDGLTAQQISDITGLPLEKAGQLILCLVSDAGRRLIEGTIRNTFVMTERGLRWVEESPVQP